MLRTREGDDKVHQEKKTGLTEDKQIPSRKVLLLTQEKKRIRVSLEKKREIFPSYSEKLKAVIVNKTKKKTPQAHITTKTSYPL